jgi:hypothetical protein
MVQSDTFSNGIPTSTFRAGLPGSIGNQTNNTASFSAPVEFGGTFRHLKAYIRANTAGNSSSQQLRVNGSAAITLTIGAGVSGMLENTSDTSGISSSNDWCFAQARSGSGGAVNYSSGAVALEVTDGDGVPLLSGVSLTNAGGITSADAYLVIGGPRATSATEATQQVAFRTATTLSLLKFLDLTSGSSIIVTWSGFNAVGAIRSGMVDGSGAAYSTLRYGPLQGSTAGTQDTTESHYQLVARTDTALRNLYFYSSANTRNATTTFALRLNGSTVISVSPGSSASGTFEETSTQVEPDATDTTNWMLDGSPGSSGSVTVNVLSIEQATPREGNRRRRVLIGAS